ncbi:hypothetical protein F5Y13DRAFT_76497 [Hypoxylon sp. FL1857]|nr:hypothetical protein F5Y13DRAFT_76497 [Hypoxylon sp. FL1857]
MTMGVEKEVHPILALMIWAGSGLAASVWYISRLCLDPITHYFGLRVTITLCLASIVLGPFAFFPVLAFVNWQEPAPADRFKDIEAQLSDSKFQSPRDALCHTSIIPMAVDSNGDNHNSSTEYDSVSGGEGARSYGTISV